MIVYQFSLSILILVAGWAIFSKRVKDKIGLIAGLLLVEFGSIGLMLQSMINSKYNLAWINGNSNAALCLGASIIAMRCFYIKSGLKRHLKR